MARRSSGVNLEVLGLIVTDAVMRALVPALNARVSQRCEALLLEQLTPLATQIEELGAAVRAGALDPATLVTLEALDAQRVAIVQACEAFTDQAITRALERIQPFTYLGAFDATRTYAENDSVTHRGSMWMARAAVPAGCVPGTEAGAQVWTLAVKCGRDARGA